MSQVARPTILVIGGTDSSGGAGLAADIRTAAAHDIDARIAVTAITAQTDHKVGTVTVMPPAPVAEQIAFALEDARVSAVKIGMLGAAATVAGVADALKEFDGPVVLDPVIATSSGGLLLSDAGIASLIARLLPRCALVTPNLPELDILSARIGVKANASVEAKAQALLKAGVTAVLVKGGHGQGSDAIDLLYAANRAPVPFSAPRLDASLRGTGCMLATAIACGLAAGERLENACAMAKSHVRARLAAGRTREERAPTKVSQPPSLP